jgi:hypothetical protein
MPPSRYRPCIPDRRAGQPSAKRDGPFWQIRRTRADEAAFGIGTLASPIGPRLAPPSGGSFARNAIATLWPEAERYHRRCRALIRLKAWRRPGARAGAFHE